MTGTDGVAGSSTAVSLNALGGRPLLRSLRPRQWVKNVLVLAAPAAAGELGDATIARDALLAVLAFTVASWAVYLGNDLADVAIDRAHPRRRSRPIAAGTLATTTARRVAIASAVFAVSLSAAVATPLVVVVAGYLTVNLSYSLGMKHVPVLELAAVASGFVLRAVAGGAATGIPLSVAFIVVVSAGSMLVVLAKRAAELERSDDTRRRRVLRHYRVETLRAARAAAATTAVVAYAVWVFAAEDVVVGFAAASLVPFAAALALYEGAVRAGLGEDPEEVFLRDRRLALVIACWVVLYGAAVYGG